MTRVTFLTDFGTADGYAAAMAAVVATDAPGAVVDHASHAIEPGDIFGAALALSRYGALYPPDTVHVVVVDPGVGTDRRAIAARIDGRYYVAPDNGVLSLVLQGANRVSMVAVTHGVRMEAVSDTFHGRDLFAPTAARLAAGAPLEDLGPPLHDPTLLNVPQPDRSDGNGVLGQVLEVDRFGNLITNVPGDWLGEGATVVLDGTDVGPVRGTYGHVQSGELVALIGSMGLLEVSVRDGNAAARLGVGRGAPVAVRL